MTEMTDAEVMLPVEDQDPLAPRRVFRVAAENPVEAMSKPLVPKLRSEHKFGEVMYRMVRHEARPIQHSPDVWEVVCCYERIDNDLKSVGIVIKGKPEEFEEKS